MVRLNLYSQHKKDYHQLTSQFACLSLQCDSLNGGHVAPSLGVDSIQVYPVANPRWKTMDLEVGGSTVCGHVVANLLEEKVFLGNFLQ